MRVVIAGGGAGGLLTGLLLSGAGHDVTVLERDPDDPPDDREAAWESWSRTGASQIRQPHGFIGRTREALANDLPAVAERLADVDGQRIDLRSTAPDPGALVDDDVRFQADVMRRTSFEHVVANVAAQDPDLRVSRGVAVTGLDVTGHSAGVPVVAGAHTEGAGVIAADLVVDCGGRRTAAARWLADIGAPVEQWSETDGFTYWTRWYRTHDGVNPHTPAGMFGGTAPGLLALIFPGDAGVFGVPMVGLAGDKSLRRLKDPAVFESVARRMPLIADWFDPAVAAPISDVIPMGSIQNRRLRFWNGESPSAHGLVNLGDSAMSSNPSLGRGIALVLIAALGLRSVLAEVDDPAAVGVEFDRFKERQLTPWLWDAVQSDRDLRALFGSALGQPAGDGPSDRTMIGRAAAVDAECWRRWTAVSQLFEMPSTCLDDVALMARAREIASDARPPAFHLSRPDLESLLV